MPSNPADRAHLSGLTVLYVEDEPTIRGLTTSFLYRRAKRVLVAEDGVEGLALFHEDPPDLVVTDIMMPRCDGLAMIEAIRAEAPELPVIITTAFEQTHFLLRSIALGVDRFVLKPIDPDQLEAALLHCAQNLRVGQELAAFQAQKLALLEAQHEETLALLAGGMAHDYNNLLQGVLAATSAAQLLRDNPVRAFALLDSTEAAWGQIKELSTNLELLGQRRAATRLADRLEPVLQASLAEAIEHEAGRVSLELPEDLPLVQFNPPQLKRVMTILVNNAFEAMGGTGRLQIVGQVRRLSRELALPLPEGDYLELSFHDQGPGIAPAMLPLMFKPYTSTKERGSQRGMGLNLAIAQAILKLHAGALVAENAATGGATLHLYLPVPGTSSGVAP